MRRVAISIGLAFLQGFAQSVWESFWDTIFTAVIAAEKRWINKGRGQVKKEYVVGIMMKWLDGKNLVKWYNKRFLRRAIENIVDRILEEANGRIGSDWINRAEELKAYLATRIPFIR